MLVFIINILFGAIHIVTIYSIIKINDVLLLRLGVLFYSKYRFTVYYSCNNIVFDFFSQYQLFASVSTIIGFIYF